MEVRLKRLFSGWVVVLLMALPSLAQEAEARRILEEVERRQAAITSEVAEIHMEIIDTRGRVRSRTMDVRSKQDADGWNRSLVVFSHPADIRGDGAAHHRNQSWR